MDFAFTQVLLPENWVFPESKMCVQLVAAEHVRGKNHVIHCINTSIKAFSQNTNVAKTLESELLIRFSGKKQIKDALKTMKPNKKAVLIVIGKNPEKEVQRIIQENTFKEIEPLKTLECKKEFERALLIN